MQKKQISITTNTLLAILQNVKGAQPIGFTSLTVPKFRKTGNPFVEIKKISRVSAMTGANYEASVNRQLTREGQADTFEAQERQWGERVAPALVKNNGAYYLVAQILKTDSPTYLARKSTNEPFKIVSKATLAPWLVQSTPSATQGTEKEIVYRNYKLESIAALNQGGNRYRIRANDFSPAPKKPTLRQLAEQTNAQNSAMQNAVVKNRNSGLAYEMGLYEEREKHLRASGE